MRRLSSLIGTIFFLLELSGQSPHGDQLKLDCAQCHQPTGWAIESGSMTFQHDSTGFPLKGRHQSLDCKSCHLNLIFSALSSQCNSCHEDPHENTVGRDCQRCHFEESWIVDDTRDVHLKNGFPLLGQHAKADCAACHQSASALRFERIGNDCIQCHRTDYTSTQNPNHQSSRLWQRLCRLS